jgi:hypothetical protein
MVFTATEVDAVIVAEFAKSSAVTSIPDRSGNDSVRFAKLMPPVRVDVKGEPPVPDSVTVDKLAPPPDVLRTSVFPVASLALSPFTFTITAPLFALTRSTLATGCARAVGGVAVMPPPSAT